MSPQDREDAYARIAVLQQEGDRLRRVEDAHYQAGEHQQCLQANRARNDVLVAVDRLAQEFDLYREVKCRARRTKAGRYYAVCGLACEYCGGRSSVRTIVDPRTEARAA